eukprot:TRINITY_DN35448_c0_g1_i1.p1 TRINITY_DN35448_c0_g1~~TRINITY_DN35448_c0_g1_i1.p1  ORF type:complete len:343 (+),score=35.13 TRINITY_DN35448_c0_g1_i1:118-1029(+)
MDVCLLLCDTADSQHITVDPDDTVSHLRRKAADLLWPGEGFLHTPPDAVCPEVLHDRCLCAITLQLGSPDGANLHDAQRLADTALSEGDVVEVRLRPAQTTPFKVVFAGDPGVGKTSFVQRVTTSTASGDAQDGATGSDRVVIETNRGGVLFDVHDVPNMMHRFAPLRDLYYLDAAAAVVMYDRTQRCCMRNCVSWCCDVSRVAPNAVIAVVANKCDVPEPFRRLRTHHLDHFRRRGHILGDISVQTGVGVWEVMLDIARRLVRDQSLCMLSTAPCPAVPTTAPWASLTPHQIPAGAALLPAE